MNSILKVKNLKTYFLAEKQEIKAVDGISFDIYKNETLAVVGESGSGKSVTALSIMRLIDYPGKIIEGEVSYNNKNLLSLHVKEISKIRGNKISMIHQDPMNSLNPAISVGEQIREALIIHKVVPIAQTKAKALELMKQVSISEAELRYNDMPSKFSGGMKQRIMTAMAIACNPEILIADEPTTALDVTIQADILALLNKMKSKLGMSLLLITHDLGVVAENADRVIVMYCGKIMEEASVKDLFKKPLHPYTIGLMKCIPRIDTVADELYSIPGYIPNAGHYSDGCRFNDRCEKVMDICKKKMPELVEIEEGHKVRCWLCK
ncbi:MAG: ABC transporter ATP-binding protein [Lutisporaceae bacterium]